MYQKVSQLRSKFCLTAEHNFSFFWFSYCKLCIICFSQTFYKSAIIILKFIFSGFSENEFLQIHFQKTVLEKFAELLVPRKCFVIKSLKEECSFSLMFQILVIILQLEMIFSVSFKYTLAYSFVSYYMLHSFISSFLKISCFSPCFFPITVL